MKHTDKTDDEWDALIEEWHNGSSDLSLPDFLGLNEEQYTRLCYGIRDDSLSYEDVLEYGRKLCMDIAIDNTPPLFKTFIRL